MTQDEIIRMAREAGLAWTEKEVPEVHHAFERFAALIAAREAEKWKVENKRDYENWKMAAEKAAECEREACANLVETTHATGLQSIREACAAAIRSRCSPPLEKNK